MDEDHRGTAGRSLPPGQGRGGSATPKTQRPGRGGAAACPRSSASQPSLAQLMKGARGIVDSGVTEFVNADMIASGLSAFRPESVAITAGRIMLARMRQLAAARENFAFETTLASRSFAPWLASLKESGYHVHLLFLWLRNAELAASRVAERVRLGGHDVPAYVVRRRYANGSRNFFLLYRPLTDSWEFLDNSETGGP